MALKKTIEPENYFRPYPPLIPVAYSFIYLLGGSHPKMIFPFFYLSLATCFYCRLVRLGATRRSSLLFTVLLATTPYVWWHSFLGILNFTTAYYFSIATLFWFFHLKDITQFQGNAGMNGSYPLLAGLFYGFSVFTRFEMLAYVFIPLLLTAGYSLRYRLSKNVVYLTLPSLGIALLWYFFSVFRLVPREGFNFTVFSGAMLLLLIAFMVSYLVVIKNGSRALLPLADTFPFGIPSLVRALGVGFILFLVLSFFMPGDGYDAFPLAHKTVLLVKTLATTSVTFLFGNIFYLATSLLIVLIPLMRYSVVGKEQSALCAFILLFVIINIAMYSYFYCSLYAQGYSMLKWHYDVVKFVKALVSHPGNLINDAQLRGLLPLYPVTIFFFAATQKIQKAFEV